MSKDPVVVGGSMHDIVISQMMQIISSVNKAGGLIVPDFECSVPTLHVPTISFPDADMYGRGDEELRPEITRLNKNSMFAASCYGMSAKTSHNHDVNSMDTLTSRETVNYFDMLISRMDTSCNACGKAYADVIIDNLDADCLYRVHRGNSPKYQYLVQVCTRMLSLYNLTHHWSDCFELPDPNDKHKPHPKEMCDRWNEATGFTLAVSLVDSEWPRLVCDDNGDETTKIIEEFGKRFYRVMRLYALTGSLTIYAKVLQLLFQRSDPRLFRYFKLVVVPELKIKGNPLLWRCGYRNISLSSKRFYEKSLTNLILRVVNEHDQELTNK